LTCLRWDASGLVKRYAPETGTDTVNALFDHTPPAELVTTVLGYAETFAILIRKRNAGCISAATCTAAIALLQDEVIHTADFRVLLLEPATIIGGTVFVERHNLNSADAAILLTYLQFAQSAAVTGSRCAIVSADTRLIRAATGKGLPAINPERLVAPDVAAFLVALG
jgi:uncharacterized protein